MLQSVRTHSLHLVGVPQVGAHAALHLGDVRAHAAVDLGTVDAQEDAQIARRPVILQVTAVGATPAASLGQLPKLQVIGLVHRLHLVRRVFATEFAARCHDLLGRVRFVTLLRQTVMMRA